MTKSSSTRMRFGSDVETKLKELAKVRSYNEVASSIEHLAELREILLQRYPSLQSNTRVPFQSQDGKKASETPAQRRNRLRRSAADMLYGHRAGKETHVPLWEDILQTGVGQPRKESAAKSDRLRSKHFGAVNVCDVRRQEIYQLTREIIKERSTLRKALTPAFDKLRDKDSGWQGKTHAEAMQFRAWLTVMKIVLCAEWATEELHDCNPVVAEILAYGLTEDERIMEANELATEYTVKYREHAGLVPQTTAPREEHHEIRAEMDQLAEGIDLEGKPLCFTGEKFKGKIIRRNGVKDKALKEKENDAESQNLS